MNILKSTPAGPAPTLTAPGDLIAALADSVPTVRTQAARSLSALFQSEDQITRWGTAFYLLQLPSPRYLPQLLTALQESSQPIEVRTTARELSNSSLLKTVHTPASLLLLYAKTRALLLLVADLSQRTAHGNE